LAVTGAKLNTDVISAQTELAVAPADADEFMVSDGGVLKRIDYSLIKGGGDNTPNFLAYRSASDQSISNATLTKVQFNSESYDTDSAYDNSTNYRFTVPAGEGGKYALYTNVWCRGTDVSMMNYYLLAFYKNGSNVWEQHSNFMNNDLRSFGANMSLTIDLAAADYIEVFGKIDINSGSPSFGNNAASGVPTTWFQGFKIG
jgi:hypothetical protein